MLWKMEILNRTGEPSFSTGVIQPFESRMAESFPLQTPLHQFTHKTLRCTRRGMEWALQLTLERAFHQQEETLAGMVEIKHDA